ncbi:hypothetical protein QQ045_026434 [Rhodiola kirilowii]
MSLAFPGPGWDTKSHILTSETYRGDLRRAICGLAVVSALLLSTAHQVKEVFMIKKAAKYSQMKVIM